MEGGKRERGKGKKGGGKGNEGKRSERAWVRKGTVVGIDGWMEWMDGMRPFLVYLSEASTRSSLSVSFGLGKIVAA